MEDTYLISKFTLLHDFTTMVSQKDYIGFRFGKLIILSYLPSDIYGHRVVNTKCDCGNITPKILSRIKTGRIFSCGCLKGNAHNLTNHVLYSTYINMVGRCYNLNQDNYKNYGGRGITVCSEWLGEKGCQTFISDMGLKPDKTHTLERKDPNKNYSKENCCWLPSFKQQWNKTNTFCVQYNGELKSLAELSFNNNLKHGIVYKRIKRGWTVEKALTTIRK